VWEVDGGGFGAAGKLAPLLSCLLVSDGAHGVDCGGLVEVSVTGGEELGIAGVCGGLVEMSVTKGEAIVASSATAWPRPLRREMGNAGVCGVEPSLYLLDCWMNWMKKWRAGERLQEHWAQPIIELPTKIKRLIYLILESFPY